MIGSSSMEVTPPRSAVTVDFCALLLYSLFSLVLVDHLKNLLIFCVKKNIFYFTRGLAATALLSHCWLYFGSSYFLGFGSFFSLDLDLCILDPHISLDSDLFFRWTWIFVFHWIQIIFLCWIRILVFSLIWTFLDALASLAFKLSLSE